MGFTRVFTYYEGAVESITDYDENDAAEVQKMNNSIAATKRFAYDNSDALVEVHTKYHSHPMDMECECHQYSDNETSWRSKND
jgi:hypothetical protein